MDVKRKQHFLPRSYLKHWVDPNTLVPNRTPMVWAISKDGRRRELKALGSSAFWADYFYDIISITGERNQTVENQLSKIENAIARIVSNRISKKGQLADHKEAEAIDLFVACMFMRTQKRKSATDSWAGAIARIEQDYAAAAGRPVPHTTAFQHNAHAFALIHGLEIISDWIKAMDHEVFIAPDGRFFVTSDEPCVWEAIIGLPGLANPTLQITLPLTPQCLLYISREGRGSAYRDAPTDVVDYLNSRTIGNCRHFISRTRDVESSWFANEQFWLAHLLSFENAATD